MIDHNKKIENSIAYLLRKTCMNYKYYVHHILQKDSRNVSKDFSIYYLSQYSCLSQNELGDLLEITPPSMKQILDQLESEGLIFRKRDVEDRRKILLTLTPLGQDQVLKVINSWKKINEELLSGMNLAESENFQHYLKKITSTLTHLTR